MLCFIPGRFNVTADRLRQVIVASNFKRTVPIFTHRSQRCCRIAFTNIDARKVAEAKQAALFTEVGALKLALDRHALATAIDPPNKTLDAVTVGAGPLDAMTNDLTFDGLAWRLGHEINNPLTIVMGNLRTIRKELAGPSFDRLNVDKKIDSAIIASERIRDLLVSFRTVSHADSALTMLPQSDGPEVKDPDVYCGAIRAIVVEDERAIRGFVIALLNDCGLSNISEAENGAEALDLIKRERFDLVLTDLKMPVMGGLDLIKAIHALSLSPRPHIAVMTGGVAIAIEKEVRDDSQKLIDSQQCEARN